VPQIRFFSLGLNRSFLKIKHTLRALGRVDSRALKGWRALYVAALFEKDEDRMIERIDEAKKALVVRARELFVSEGDHLQEQAAIEDTLQFLHELERCTLRPHTAH
jgi:erythromycin esterase-like protein